MIMNLAAAIRVFGSAWSGDSYRLWIDLSAGLWVLCFALFAWHYVPDPAASADRWSPRL